MDSVLATLGAFSLGGVIALNSELALQIASYLAAFPAAILCLLPMHNQLKCSTPAALVRILLLMALAIPLAAYANVHFGLDPNTLIVPLLLAFFIVFQLHVKASPACSIAVIALVCALMSIMANYANAFDAMLRPDAVAGTFSIEAALFQLAISTATLVVLGWFFWNFGAEIVDNLKNDGIWCVTTLVSAVMIGFNAMLYPVDYSVIRAPNDFTEFLVMLSLLMLLLLMAAGLFFFTVSEIQDKHRMEDRNRMLEVQESQYQSQRAYLEASSRARHDFRQTVRTLKSLSEAGEYEKLDEYLDNYIESLPSSNVVQYCRNNAVNALLNYYAQNAAQENVALNLSIDLPEQLSVNDVDLCSMLGNILENAVTAAKHAPEGKRWIDLVATTQLDAQLIIVASNGMAGNLKIRNGEYLSTSHHGSGVGLRSIRNVAERHGGIAEFSNTEDEFRTDVMIPLH